MYIITSKLNTTFGTIGKATGVKMTGKAVGKKKETFALAWRIIWTNGHGTKHACKILNNFFSFKIGFFAPAIFSVNENLLLLNFLVYFIWFPVFGNFKF